MDSLFSFDEVPELHTERLLLRRIDATGDLDALFRLFGDPWVAFSTDTGPFTEMSEAEEVMAWFESIFRTHQGLRWAITLPEEGEELIGTCGVNVWNRINRSAEIGYDLMPGYWGRGIATEAVEGMVGWCFDNLGVNRIQADVMVGNERSMRVLEKLGFVAEGVQRQGGYWRDEYHDLRYFGLLREDWQ